MTPALVDAAIVIGTTLAATVFLLIFSGQLHDTTAGSLIARSPAPAYDPIVTAQPSPAQSLIDHPTPSPQTSRPPASPSPTEDSSPADDTTIQATIDKKIQDSADLAYPITVAVSSGSVTLDGTVPSKEVKERIEKLVRTVRGVKQVDNQIVVISGN
jgi:hypothetical protein